MGTSPVACRYLFNPESVAEREAFESFFIRALRYTCPRRSGSLSYSFPKAGGSVCTRLPLSTRAVVDIHSHVIRREGDVPTWLCTYVAGGVSTSLVLSRPSRTNTDLYVSEPTRFVRSKDTYIHKHLYVDTTSPTQGSRDGGRVEKKETERKLRPRQLKRVLFPLAMETIRK